MVPRPKGEESDLGGGTASRSPFQRIRCLPFSDASKRPATKGSYPLGIPRCFADGQSSEAWNRAAFDSLGQKRRVFETPSLIHNEAFHHGKKDASFEIQCVDKDFRSKYNLSLSYGGEQDSTETMRQRRHVEVPPTSLNGGKKTKRRNSACCCLKNRHAGFQVLSCGA